MKIKTNNQPRPILHWHKLSAKEKQEFDYMETPEDASFFRYKGWTYTLGDFMREGTPEGWDGCSTQSAWETVLVRIVDNESVIIGRAFW